MLLFVGKRDLEISFNSLCAIADDLDSDVIVKGLVTWACFPR